MSDVVHHEQCIVVPLEDYNRLSIALTHWRTGQVPQDLHDIFRLGEIDPTQYCINEQHFHYGYSCVMTYECKENVTSVAISNELNENDCQNDNALISNYIPCSTAHTPTAEPQAQLTPADTPTVKGVDV